MASLNPSDFRIRPNNVLDHLRIGDWFAHPDRPLEVDVGCGKGRFLLARARKRPEVNFLGIDRLLGRIRKIERRAAREGMTNIRLLRIDAYYAVTFLLPTGSVSVYTIFFPDPWPKARHHRHRLFNMAFMDAMNRTLTPDGEVHVATDHLPYFEEIEDTLRGDPRFAARPPLIPPVDERTDFELRFIDTRPIGRVSFGRAPSPESPVRHAPMNDEQGT